MEPEPRSVDTRRKILEAAETEFARSGYAGTHLQKIASEVGVQKTALYYYFDSKAALYTTVLERMLAELERTISRATGRGEPSVAGLGRLLDDVNDVLAEHPTYPQILIRIFVDRVEFDRSGVAPLVRRIVDSVLRYYRAGVEAGAFRKRSARHVFQSILGVAVFHYAAREFSATVTDVDDVFTRSAVAWRRDEVRELLLRGVAAE